MEADKDAWKQAVVAYALAVKATEDPRRVAKAAVLARFGTIEEFNDNQIEIWDVLLRARYSEETVERYYAHQGPSKAPRLDPKHPDYAAISTDRKALAAMKRNTKNMVDRLAKFYQPDDGEEEDEEEEGEGGSTVDRLVEHAKGPPSAKKAPAARKEKVAKEKVAVAVTKPKKGPKEVECQFSQSEDEEEEGGREDSDYESVISDVTELTRLMDMSKGPVAVVVDQAEVAEEAVPSKTLDEIWDQASDIQPPPSVGKVPSQTSVETPVVSLESVSQRSVETPVVSLEPEDPILIGEPAEETKVPSPVPAEPAPSLAPAPVPTLEPQEKTRVPVSAKGGFMTPTLVARSKRAWTKTRQPYDLVDDASHVMDRVLGPDMKRTVCEIRGQSMRPHLEPAGFKFEDSDGGEAPPTATLVVGQLSAKSQTMPVLARYFKRGQLFLFAVPMAILGSPDFVRLVDDGLKYRLFPSERTADGTVWILGNTYAGFAYDQRMDFRVTYESQLVQHGIPRMRMEGEEESDADTTLSFPASSLDPTVPKYLCGLCSGPMFDEGVWMVCCQTRAHPACMGQSVQSRYPMWRTDKQLELKCGCETVLTHKFVAGLFPK